MGATMVTLLTRPNQYFEAFEDRSPDWLIAYLGYYLVAFVEAIGNLSFADTSIPPTSIIARSAFSSILGAVINLAIFGIAWIYLGSKILGGKVSFKGVVQAVGYAFVWPGIFSLITVPLMLFLGDWRSNVSAARVLLYILLPAQIIAGLWALVYAVLAARQLNKFGWLRTLGVVIWFPVLLVAVVLGLSVLR
jgi:hypothetical protein